MQLDVYFYTNSGGRDYNEDFAEGYIEDTEAFFVLADGLGGHKGGEQASRFVVRALLKAWKERPEDLAEEMAWLKQQIDHANTALLEFQRDSHNKMKSTVAALYLKEEKISWAHVGDSRIYHLTEQGISCLTVDHSVTYKKYLAGEIRKEEIPFDEDRSSLLRAVGDSMHGFPDCQEMMQQGNHWAGDAFLLCSDGFWEYLKEEEILVDFFKTKCAEDWGKQMLLRLMGRIVPKSDNLTLVAIRVQEEKEMRETKE